MLIAFTSPFPSCPIPPNARSELKKAQKEYFSIVYVLDNIHRGKRFRFVDNDVDNDNSNADETQQNEWNEEEKKIEHIFRLYKIK